VQKGLAEEGITSCSYDRPGYGFSPLPETEEKSTLQYHIDNIHQLLSLSPYINYGRVSMVHVGHSYGGGIALGYAGTFPENVKGLILLEPCTEYAYQHPSFRKLFVHYSNVIAKAKLITQLGISTVLSIMGIHFFPIPNHEYSGLYKKFDLEVDTFIAMENELKDITEFHEAIGKYQTIQNKELDVVWVEPGIFKVPPVGLSENDARGILEANADAKKRLGLSLKVNKFWVEKFELMDHLLLPSDYLNIIELIHDFM